MSERGQISVAACGLLVLLVLAGYLLGTLATVDQRGGTVQRAADMAGLAAGRALSEDPAAERGTLEQAAAAAAQGNGARFDGLRVLERAGLPAGVEVRVSVPAAGGQRVRARAQASVTYSAALPAAGFRPVDLHGARGRAGVVAAAEAQVGWPYVWGGESRAEGGFDCSGLIDYAFAVAGAPLPGRPTAAALWTFARRLPASALEPGDLVFAGARSGAAYHVGMYVGGGVVLSAPHTGVRVGYSPLSAGGWDGYGSLLPAEPVAESAAAAAARRHGVPAHVIESELRLGLAADAESAARGLSAQLDGADTLEAALAAQLGDRSAAALVLRDGSGPALALSGSVRLMAVGQGEVDAVRTAEPRPPGVVTRRPPDQPALTWGDRMGTALGAGEHAAEQLAERGRIAPLQAAAALAHASRFGLTGLGMLLPDPDWRDAANLAGSVWDAAGATRGLAEGMAGEGSAVDGFGLWAARFSLVGSALSTGLFTAEALRARRRRDRIGYGLMAAGSAATTVGLLSAGGSLMALGAAGSVIPPVGLTLIAVGAGLCVAGYLVRHPDWVRAGLRAGGRVLDLAWRVQTAPVRLASSAASAAVSGAKSVVDAIPTPW